MKRIFTIAILLVFGLAGAACGGAKQNKPDKKATEQNRAQQQAAADRDKVEEPSEEELAKSPCGNPNWAKLPEGAEPKAEQSADDDHADDADSTDPDVDDSAGSDREAGENAGDC
jgi:hypothetical protein